MGKKWKKLWLYERRHANNGEATTQEVEPPTPVQSEVEVTPEPEIATPAPKTTATAVDASDKKTLKPKRSVKKTPSTKKK